jgi:proline utilization trans-activator
VALLIVYLGTSSNWSFTGRILRLIHQKLFQAPLPANAILFDGTAYDLGWSGTRAPPECSSSPPIMPSPDYAIYLLNTVKFRCGQMFHLFDEDDFKSNLHKFYTETEGRVEKAGLWYIQFLLILAFGKALILSKNSDKRPAGLEFFVRAMQLLPDVTSLCREPILSTEILCAIALYLNSIDYRNSADVVVSKVCDQSTLIHGPACYMINQ